MQDTPSADLLSTLRRDAPIPQLPAPRRTRWQPIRGGLVNIYRYDYQEFHYEDGRLLLRGNNGTGKSRVLALQLPFLLDGEIVPQRVEPDQDQAKRMEWNLLLGGKHDDRLGYTWIEFGKQNERGEPDFKTLGCGLRAVQGRGIAQQWFFVTNQRMGEDLFLVNEAGQPLSKTKLELAIGARGEVFGSGRIEEDRREYRNAVDKALFRLSDRYEPLLNLLIQLRQPQLSRTLNEARLSDALSEALAPLPASVLADVAEAFRSLETDRQELEDFKAARQSADQFLKEYQRYVQIAARRRAEEVRKTHSAYETTMRRLRAAESEHDQATQTLERLKVHLAELGVEQSKAAAAERTLRDSPEMKDARTLEETRLAAESARKTSESARNERDRSAATLAREQHQRQGAAEKAAARFATVRTLAERASQDAQAAGLGQKHQTVLEHIVPPEIDLARLEKAAGTLQEQVQRRLQNIRHLAKLNLKVEAARQRAISSQQSFALAESHLSEGIEAEGEASKRLENGITALVRTWETWAASLVELHPLDAEVLEVSFRQWCETSQGESPVGSAIKQAERAALQRIEATRASLQPRLQTAREEVVALQSEVEGLQSGQYRVPPPPHTRDMARRASRLGAPLWGLCDFADAVPENERAPIEAALEASGILDAWVTPEGRLLDPDDHDTVLGAGISPLVSQNASLASVLVPSIDSKDQRAQSVSETTVRALLQHIGFGAETGTVWVDSTGRWQLGALAGSWSKPAAQYIGHAAREAARRQRLEELRQQIEAKQDEIRALQADLADLEKRAARLAQEVGGAPHDGNVRNAIAQLEAARQAVSRFRLRLAEVEAQYQEAQRLLRSATQERDEAAADLGLSAWIDQLEALGDAVHNYGNTLAELWPAMRALVDAHAQLGLAEDHERDAQQRFDLHESQRKTAENTAAAALESFRILESTVGAAVLQIQERLKVAVERVERLRAERERLEAEETQKKIEQGIAKTRIEDATEDLGAKEQQRGVAIGALVTFAATRQLAVAHPEFGTLEAAGWSAARAVDVARRIETLLAQVESTDETWSRNQKEIHSHFETLQSSLRAHGYLPEGSVSDGIFIVSIHFQGRACTIAELRDSVLAIIQERQQLLDAREREVLENYLIDEVAEHLHDLLHRALRWKEEINAELSGRPMSTGLTLRFVWEPLPDLPATFNEARRLLMHARGTWSPAQRASVGEFLQQQIKSVRAANDTGTWQDHLSQAFDYRKWHQFGVERKQEGVWKRLTRRTHGTGSGGEKAIALTLPQLAAAAAHYRSADENAPRLILLDEAFVGVDKNMRAKCMDLLRVFDLDVVMTSESEWGCYPTVPAIAIYQLSAREGIDAVHAARWVWNGKQRLRDDAPAPAVRPSSNGQTQAKEARL